MANINIVALSHNVNLYLYYSTASKFRFRHFPATIAMLLIDIKYTPVPCCKLALQMLVFSTSRATDSCKQNYKSIILKAINDFFATQKYHDLL